MLVRKVKVSGASIVSIVSLAYFDALAQQGGPPAQMAPVTITGTALAALPQSESSTVTIVSGQEVEPGEITSLRDLSAQTPNFMAFDSYDQRSPKFSARGFRENNFGAGEPVVGFYVDDVPYYDLLSRGVALYDVRDMEFLSGDQGTLYGASGVGGVVNIATHQPDNVTHGYLETSYGNYNSQNYQLGLGGALVKDTLFFSVGGLYALRDGFVYNNF